MNKILLLRTQLVNVGNGFIEKGAKACIKQVLPEADIIEVSGYSNHIKYLERRSNLLFSMKNFYENFDPAGMINIPELIKDIDLAVLPGCVLDRWSMPKYVHILKKLRQRNIPLIILGGGGNNYDKKTTEYVKKILNMLKPDALITRDHLAYKIYSQLTTIKNVYNGIDCAFFIKDWYVPPPSRKKFVILNFDKLKKIPNIETNYPIIHVTHKPFDLLYLQNPFTRVSLNIFGRIAEGIGYTEMNPPRFFKHKPFFVSDIIEDYLFLYANAKEVHSDRVHACVATLAYGNKAKLYYSTPRATLFENVGCSEITQKLVFLEESKLQNKKRSVLNYLQEITANII